MARRETRHPLQVSGTARVTQARRNIGKKFVGDCTLGHVVPQTDQPYLRLRINVWYDIGVMRPLSRLPKSCHKKIALSVEICFHILHIKYSISSLRRTNERPDPHKGVRPTHRRSLQNNETHPT